MVVGKAWTSEEYAQLATELAEKKTYKEMAEAHGRTENAIRFKVIASACDQVIKEFKTNQAVSEKMGISLEDLQKELNRRTQPVVKKQAPVVVKKNVSRDASNELADILSAVTSVQSRLARYISMQK